MLVIIFTREVVLLVLKGGSELKGERDRIVLIYVDSFDNGILSGRFHISSNPEVQTFHGLLQLLTEINNNLDRENFPQSFSELRRFQKPSEIKEDLTVSANFKNGKVATFSMRILFRQNASWQGSLTWVEGKQEEYFRSVLELIVLLENALRYTMNME